MCLVSKGNAIPLNAFLQIPLAVVLGEALEAATVTAGPTLLLHAMHRL